MRFVNLITKILLVKAFRNICSNCTLLALMLFASCEIINPEEEVPSFVRIDKINLNVTNPAKEGSSSHNIVDAWVYVNDNPIGIFELPVTIPILEAGNHQLKIAGGIKNTGFTNLRLSYPFYAFYVNDTSFTLYRDSVVDVTPAITYFDDINFAWIEDFEDVGISIDSATGSDVNIDRITSGTNVFEGNASGAVYLDSSKPVFKGLTQEKFDLPRSGVAVFVELDYKITTQLQVKLRANETAGYTDYELIILNPKTDSDGNPVWNKIYIEATGGVLNKISALDYQLYFVADIGSVASGEVFIDNIKLLHQ